MTDDSPLRVEELDGGIRVLTLDRSTRRNALDARTLEALAEALAPQRAGNVRVLLLQGAQAAFCSGYDLGELSGPGDDGTLPDDRLGEVLALLPAFPAPSVALVDGPAFGAGCELAASCDFRVGAPSALFCLPPAKLGIVYAEEGMAKVARIVGLQRARLMFLTGRRIDANTAAAWGLLDEVGTDAPDAQARAVTLCRELAANAPLAVRGMRGALALLARSPLDESERERLRQTRREAFSSRDAQEGRASFLDKRPPAFEGR
jgi:enoyl-CoA hydratase/carnithine racemase